MIEGEGACLDFAVTIIALLAELVDVSFFCIFIFFKFRLNKEEGGTEIDLYLLNICQCGRK